MAFNDVRSTTKKRFRLGQRQFDVAKNEYIFMAGAASTAAGDWVTYDENFATTRLSTLANPGPVAVATEAVGADGWTWYQVYGSVSATVNTISDNSPAYVSATAGTISGTASVNGQVTNVSSRSASSGGSATFWLQYPYYGNDAASEASSFASVTSTSWMRAADGAAGTPSFSFTTDTNTGLFLGASDELRAVTGGVAKLVINSTAVTVTGTGRLQLPDGTVTAPSLTFDSETGANTGFYWGGQRSVRFSDDGTVSMAFGANLELVNSIIFGAIGSGDTVITRDAANVLAQRNGTTAQLFNVYNTYTSATDKEYGGFQWASNIFYVGTDKGSGGGSTRAMKFLIGGTARWQISTAGHLLAEADNTYDIGASGATRPANIYVVNSLNMAAGGYYIWATRAIQRSPADGIIQFLNNAENGFTRLVFGTNDTSGVAIKKDGTDVAIRLGDDSAPAFLLAGVNSAITASTTQTQGQQPLTREVNVISVCANANDVVTMPSAAAGRKVTVINNGAQTLQIFPASGDNIGAGVDASATLAAASNRNYVAIDATNWEIV